jgi:hypothetical protein
MDVRILGSWGTDFRAPQKNVGDYQNLQSTTCIIFV